MTIGAPGTTPAGDNPARISGAHFDGQGPHDPGTGQNANPLILRNIDKRIYIGEASGGPQSGSWEIGLVVYAIKKRDGNVHQQFMDSYDENQAAGSGRNLPEQNEGKFDVMREQINKTIELFNKWHYAFQKKLAVQQMGGQYIDKAWQQMSGGGPNDLGLGQNLDPLGKAVS
jgi:hypothetical protein